MSYYVEMSDGQRYKCDEWVYMIFVQIYNYMHIIRTDTVTIIKKGS